MRLVKEFITPSDVVTPPEEQLHESNDRDELKRIAESIARGMPEASDAMWDHDDIVRDRISLNVSPDFHLVIKP